MGAQASQLGVSIAAYAMMLVEVSDVDSDSSDMEMVRSREADGHLHAGEAPRDRSLRARQWALQLRDDASDDNSLEGMPMTRMNVDGHLDGFDERQGESSRAGPS